MRREPSMTTFLHVLGQDPFDEESMPDVRNRSSFEIEGAAGSKVSSWGDKIPSRSGGESCDLSNEAKDSHPST